MEAALALAGPLLALAREQQGQEQQLEDQEGQLLEAEGPLVAAGPGKHGDEEEDDGESSHRPAALDRRALLRRRLYALGDEEVRNK